MNSPGEIRNGAHERIGALLIEWDLLMIVAAAGPSVQERLEQYQVPEPVDQKSHDERGNIASYTKAKRKPA